MNICIFGASSDSIDKIYFDEVRLLGNKLAERNHALVYGGGAHGLMGAAARGFAEKGGKVIGIAPSFFDVDDILYKESGELIFTETMSERKKLMEDSSDAFIVAPGGVGTFEEFFEVLTLKQLQQINKPIVIFNVNSYYDKLEELLVSVVEHKFMKEECKAVYRIFSKAEEIIDYIENYNETNENVLKY
jgi:uncharacterized protein (TIGR00730 family)